MINNPAQVCVSFPCWFQNILYSFFLQSIWFIIHHLSFKVPPVVNEILGACIIPVFILFLFNTLYCVADTDINILDGFPDALKGVFLNPFTNLT